MPTVKMGSSCKALDSKTFVLSQKERQLCEINHRLCKTDSQRPYCMDTVACCVKEKTM